jgi:hypothetical protein
MSNLGNDKDVRGTLSALEGGGNFFRLQKGINYVAILDAEYAEEFVHFVKVQGKTRKVACLGGLEGKGFAPEACPICKQVLAFYEEAQELAKGGDEGEADIVKKKGNRLRAVYQAYFQVANGEPLKVLEKGKRVMRADFEKFDGVAKVLPLSDARFKAIVSLIHSDEHSEIESGEDLVGRVLKIVLDQTNSQVKSVVPLEKIDIAYEEVDLTKALTISTDDDYADVLLEMDDEEEDEPATTVDASAYADEDEDEDDYDDVLDDLDEDEDEDVELAKTTRRKAVSKKTVASKKKATKKAAKRPAKKAVIRKSARRK